MKLRKNRQENKVEQGAPTLIGTNSSFEGNFKGRENVCVEGEYKGCIEAEESVFVNKGGRVYADIFARYVVVHGVVQGNITAGEAIHIGPTGHVDGDVASPSLTVVTGGALNGQCRMMEKGAELPGDSSSRSALREAQNSLQLSRESQGLESQEQTEPEQPESDRRYE